MDIEPPPLEAVAESVAKRAPDSATVTALVADLAATLGPAQISTVEAARRAASTDFAHVSPVLAGLLPTRLADAVVFPRTSGEIAEVLRLAHRHKVAVTPRGAGTGSYGQAVPLAGGVVVDLTRCDQVLAAGDGWIKAQAGVTFVELEAAARASGQEIAMLPTTVGSTLGGFLGGGAGGVGSIQHGWLWDNFVLSLDVVTCPPAAEPITVHEQDCRPYLHAYGVTGIIATATVRLAPAVSRVAVLASFPTLESAAMAGQRLLRLEPAPRLVSIDEPGLVATYPADPAMPEGRVSLRAVLAEADTGTMTAAVSTHGGRIEAIRPKGPGYLSTLAFNHVTLRARRARPDLCHLQVAGDTLVTRIEEIRELLPGALLHLDGLRVFLDPGDPARGRSFGGLLFFPYQDAKSLYQRVACLGQLDVIVVDPHTWLLGGPALPAMRAAAAANDPQSLLNPGRLPPAR
jgi:hypothetical protein